MDTDASLLHAYARERDAGAFRELVSRYAGYVYGVCLRVTGDRHDAEDVAQECFLALARSAGKVTSSPAAWLHTVAVRRASNAVRNAATRRRHETQAPAAGACAPTWAEIAPHVDRALDELPAPLREALLLHYVHERTQADIAAEAGVNQSTVSRRLEKGLRLLRKKLGRTGVIAPAAVLAGLLGKHAAGTAPATLTAAISKMAMSGVGAAAVTGTAVAVKLAVAGLVAAGAVAVGVAAIPDEPTAPAPAAPVAENAPVPGPALEEIKDELLAVAKLVRERRTWTGGYPTDLDELDEEVPDLGLRYEATRRRFVITARGPDGVHGTGDDPVLVAHFADEEVGTRAGLYPLPDEDPDSQYEYLYPGDVRPMGDCFVSGRVVDAMTGEPVEHAIVGLHGASMPGNVLAQVAADGSFEFRDVSAGNYELRSFRTPGYQRAAYSPEGPPEGRTAFFKIAEAEVLEGIELRAEKAYQVSGRLLDEYGRPLAAEDDVLVTAWRKLAAPGFAGRMYKGIGETRWSPRDSSFMVDGLDGEPVSLMAAVSSANGAVTVYPPCYYPGTFARDEATLITLDDERHVSGIDLRLRRTGGLVLEGTVTDEGTGDAVPDAMVLIHRIDMLMDVAIAYSDEAGRYRFECLGAGEFLMHVDATPTGHVRTRETVFLTEGDERATADVTLRRGVRFAGRVVDTDGRPLNAVRFGGAAQIVRHPEPRTPCWGRLANRHCPRSLSPNQALFRFGDGDYGDAVMLMLTESEFLILAMMPGETEFGFWHLPNGYRMLKVLHEGADVTGFGLFSEPGESYEDIEIVIGPKPEPEQ